MTEIKQLKSFYEKKEHFFVTFERPNSKELAEKKKVYFVTDPKRNPVAFLLVFIQSALVFLKEKPKIIVSTGAGAAIPICLIGKLFGSKIIFVESYCRITRPSLSGKIFYKFADLFIVQWPELLKFFPKAKYWGAFF